MVKKQIKQQTQKTIQTATGEELVEELVQAYALRDRAESTIRAILLEVEQRKQRDSSLQFRWQYYI